jgi:hypothetical protein
VSFPFSSCSRLVQTRMSLKKFSTLTDSALLDLIHIC